MISMFRCMLCLYCAQLKAVYERFHRIPREFRIERRHIAALTWDAMFRSMRAAILADGRVI